MTRFWFIVLCSWPWSLLLNLIFQRWKYFSFRPIIPIFWVLSPSERQSPAHRPLFWLTDEAVIFIMQFGPFFLYDFYCLLWPSSIEPECLILVCNFGATVVCFGQTACPIRTTVLQSTSAFWNCHSLLYDNFHSDPVPIFQPFWCFPIPSSSFACSPMPTVKNAIVFNWHWAARFSIFPALRLLLRKTDLFLAHGFWTIWLCQSSCLLLLEPSQVPVAVSFARILIFDFLRVKFRDRFSCLSFRKKCYVWSVLFMWVAIWACEALPLSRRWPSKRHHSSFWFILHLWLECASLGSIWWQLWRTFGGWAHFLVRSWQGRVACTVFRSFAVHFISRCF